MTDQEHMASVRKAAAELNQAISQASRAGLRLEIDLSQELQTLAGRFPPRFEIRAWREL